MKYWATETVIAQLNAMGRTEAAKVVENLGKNRFKKSLKNLNEVITQFSREVQDVEKILLDEDKYLNEVIAQFSMEVQDTEKILINRDDYWNTLNVECFSVLTFVKILEYWNEEDEENMSPFNNLFTLDENIMEYHMRVLTDTIIRINAGLFFVPKKTIMENLQDVGYMCMISPVLLQQFSRDAYILLKIMNAILLKFKLIIQFVQLDITGEEFEMFNPNDEY